MHGRCVRIIGVACLSIVFSSAHASDPDADAWRGQGLLEYDVGHYTAAVRHFRRAAESGDARSAEMLCLMHRFGPTLYGDQIPASPAEAARWASLAAERRLAVAAAETVPGR